VCTKKRTFGIQPTIGATLVLGMVLVTYPNPAPPCRPQLLLHPNSQQAFANPTHALTEQAA